MTLRWHALLQNNDNAVGSQAVRNGNAFALFKLGEARVPANDSQTQLLGGKGMLVPVPKPMRATASCASDSCDLLAWLMLFVYGGM